MAWRTTLVVLAVAAASAGAAQAQPAEDDRPRPTPFDRGRMNLGFAAGSQNVDGDNHIYVAGGFGYYALAGLEVGASGLYLFGANQGALGPRIRYVFHQVPIGLKPYLGVFHSHWFVDDDYDTGGVRGGVIALTGGLLIGVGVAYETVLGDCTGDDCDLWYPELALAVAF